jgi:hypothetical protein
MKVLINKLIIKRLKLITVSIVFANIFYTSAMVAPVLSPLATTTDAIGQSLQNTMIWASPETKGEAYFVAFRKSFQIKVPRRLTTLSLFADVRYMVWINGQYALRGPSRFEPTGPEYDSMDITRFLKPGSNVIVVVVMANAGNGKMRRHAPGLTARIDIKGRKSVITDESWKWSDKTRYRNARIDWGNTHDRIDARVEDGDWLQPGYNDLQWKKSIKIDGNQWGLLTARRTPLLRETPVSMKITNSLTLPVTLIANQKLEFKLDRLTQAYTILEIDAEKGTEISLDYAGIQYIAKGGKQTYISSDTYGFAEGSVTVKSGRATINRIQLIERLYPFDIAGSFKSNDQELNCLWALCARSCQVFSEDSYVDCADRERTEWMDDDPPAFNITRTAMAGPGKNSQKVYADPRLLGALLRRTALTVQPEGWVKAHTCSDRFDIHAKMEDRSCDWVEGARRYYESTGDKKLIREIWPVIVRQMNYFLKLRTSRGLVLAREWEVWGNPVGYVTCEGSGLNAFIYKALVDAAFLGEAIGENPQAAEFNKAANDLKMAFNKVLWNEKDGTYYSGYTEDYEKAKGGRKVNLPLVNNLIASTIFPALFALDQGIVPESRREKVMNYLFTNRDQADRIMTFYYLFSQMYRADNSSFDKEILDTMRSKWKEMIAWPWQTTWEEFEGASKAHIYGMFPGYFLSSYVLGVHVDGPVWNKHLLIEPRLGDLTSLEGVVVTEFGPVPVSWKLVSGKLAFRIEIPAGVKATLRIPQMGDQAKMSVDGKPDEGKKEGRYIVIEVSSGKHTGNVMYTPVNRSFTPKHN